ncbi:MAG: hypothetical protein QOJ07_2103 [Thermoleophilaceae bacterium]|nr:hypothetical protein [Thermoleophilaceae bacterium]
MHDALKLTAYLGERDRADGAFVADRLLDLYERHGLAASVLLRGIEGFGARRHVHTQRLLTLSDDLPLVAVAVDRRERIEAVVPEVEALDFDGLVTLERARLMDGAVTGDLPGETRLMVYLGRHERIAGRPAHVAVVAALHAHGVAGATVLLGVDGTDRGERRRAAFVGSNARVPLIVQAVGDGAAMTEALAQVGGARIATVERVTVLRRDGRRVADIPRAPASGEPMQLKLTVYAGEQSRHGDGPLYLELIRGLRVAGAAGATALRGIWGYHGDHEPHGDRLLALARRVPVVTTVVDEADRARRWFAEVIEPVTGATGLVTSEWVPVAHTRAESAGRATFQG